ncbi:MAG: formate dehydrogenase subunit alpha [Rubrivivax sp.]
MNATTRVERALLQAPEVALEIDGRAVRARTDETLIEVARREGIEVPHLCWTPGLAPAGNCRACVVEVAGERTLAASCCRRAAEGLKVSTTSERARTSQRLVLELLQSDLPEARHTRDNEVDHWSEKLGVGLPRFPARTADQMPAADLSHPAIAVNLDACIQCTRCLRACRDEQANDVIGLALRGPHARIVFDMDDPMGASTCVACGECVQACPTGALAPAREAALQPVTRSVDSVCPYCGVGCQLTYHVADDVATESTSVSTPSDRIVYVEGRNGPANQGRLCVKGRYGFDYARHPQRLTAPLIRLPGAPKDPALALDPAVARSWFREATWEEALAVSGGALRRIRDERGPRALAGFGSAKGSNEEAYLFQKLVRLGFGSNNVDHCTRLCHASSVAALLEGIGSGAVSNPVMDVAKAECVIVIGANPVVNHPVAATWIKNAVRGGTKLVVMDPRRSELARHASHVLQFKPDTDVALLNAMMHVIVEEGLVDQAFVDARTEGFEALRDNVRGYSPEAMAPLCGIDADTIREVARLYATSRASMILWGMGVSQHVHGTDNARCLIALALMTGQIGRPGTGLHPLRGQNNVQGASDAGLIPMMYPDYHRVDHAPARALAAEVWGVSEQRLDHTPGLTVVEVMNAILDGRLHGMYVMGENPAMSDPDANHAREALSRLDMLVVQDLFLTETACLADVVLPASAFAEKTGTFTNTDRIVQLGRQALSLPGQARQDLWILTAMAAELGLDWHGYGATPTDCTTAVARVFDEMRRMMPSIAGITWDRLQRDGAVTYPCEQEGDPGEPVVFTDHFPRPGGRARFVPADIVPAAERPDAEYPMVLITGRQLEHWHTGSMTRRSAVLDAIEPDPVALIHPLQLERLGIRPGDLLTVSSRRGQVSLYARADEGTPEGAVFVAFCWAEAAINRLTNPALDPVAKIPEFKYCAVRLTPGGSVPAGGSFGRGQVLSGATTPEPA